MTSDRRASLVPNLRFPEFRNSPDWSAPRGDALFDAINNRSAPQGLPVLAVTQEHGAIPRDQIDYHVSVTEASVASYKEVRKGDFIISLRSFQGGIEYSNYHGICSPAYVILRRKRGDNEHYFRHLFKTKRFIQQLTRNLEGLRDGKMISYAQFSEQTIPIPERKEQDKIADCLGSLDDLISIETQKLNALRQHKQGLMQRLFPKPGKTVPELGNRIEWKIRDFPNVAFFQEGPGIMAADFFAEGVPLVRLSGVSGTTVTLDGCNYLDPEKVAQKWEHFRLESGDLLISTSASLGRVSIVSDEAAGAVFYTGLVRFRTKSEQLSESFLKVYLESPHFIRQVEGHAVGGGIKHFGPTHLRQMQIQFPGLIEQGRIADCISYLNSGIDLQSMKLETLNQHKNGLLQQLFPASGAL